MLSTSRNQIATDHVIVVPAGFLSGFKGWFARSRPILRARLLYAGLGWLTFCAPIDGQKKGLKSKPKFGGFRWDATTNTKRIRREFRKEYTREQNIGLPTGPENGLFVIETDTAAGHGEGIDGAAALQAWEAVHGALPETLKAITPSGSIHHFLLYPTDGRKVVSGSHIFGPGSGVDVKGWGSMVIAAPSTRPASPGKPGGTYQWLNWGTPIAAAPEALLSVVVEQTNTDNVIDFATGKPLVANDNKLGNDRSTPCSNPFDHVGMPRGDGVGHWDIVNQTALKNLSAWIPQLFPGGAEPYQDGFTISSAWLKRDLQERISALPIGITDFGLERGFTPIDLVIEHRHCDKYEAKAWLCECFGIENEVGISFDVNEVVEPTTPAASFHALEDARGELQCIVGKFIYLAISLSDKAQLFLKYIATWCDIIPDQLVQAIRTATGLGKSLQIILAIVASDLKRAIYAVPNHYLSSEIEQRFLELNASVKIFRGMMQDDPLTPGKKMCLKPKEAELALAAGMSVARSLCGWRGEKCDLFDVCGYQRQKIDDTKVIVVASDMLFHDQPALGKPDLVVIDEAIWKKSLRGVSSNDGFFLDFNELKYQDKSEGLRDLAIELEKLQDGPLVWRYFYYMRGVNEQNLHAMRITYWGLIERLIEKIDIHPNLPWQEVRKRFREHKYDAEELKRSRNIITLLEEMSRFLRMYPDDDSIRSGRILIETREDKRGIRWRGMVPIVSRYRVAATLLLDATLPDRNVLQAMFPNIEIVGDISVDFPPSVCVRQYLGSPTSANKLVHTTGKKKPERYLTELRRHILKRWIETGRQPSLVICQQKVEAWLKDRLPATIMTAHLNAISGLDHYRGVRLLIIAGRTIPDPYKVEAIAATISGVMPKSVAADADAFAWYERVKRAIRLRDGTGRNTFGDRHPDPLVEAIRWLICEGELVQAIGRGRGINRDENSPLDIDLLLNECLPGAVDQVLAWDDQSALIDTALEGVMLGSAIDLVRVWPELWPNLARAKRTISDGIPTLPGFTAIDYRLAGPKLKTRTGYFDLNLIPDPQQWLKERLGPLTLGRLTAASGSSAHFPYIEFLLRKVSR